MAENHTVRMEIDMSAVSLGDLADKLYDLARDIEMGEAPTQAVFASPSCSGFVTVTHIGGPDE